LSEVAGGGGKKVAVAKPPPQQQRSSSVDESSEVEDISDEAVGLRHEPLEADERRKFRCVPRGGHRGAAAAAGAAGGAVRAMRRTDSRAESSGANTPGPISIKQNENEKKI
jgi:hypothetical protein